MFFDYITASHLIIMDGLLVQLVLDTLWQLENYSYDVTWSVGPNNNIIFINAEKLYNSYTTVPANCRSS